MRTSLVDITGDRPSGPQPVGEHPQHVDLVVVVRVAERRAHQEAVELGLGQAVRALLLDRVLGGDDDERPGHVVAGAVDGDVALLHHLEQRGLRLRRRPVDLVGEHDVGEHGAAAEVERCPGTGCRRGRR